MPFSFKEGTNNCPGTGTAIKRKRLDLQNPFTSSKYKKDPLLQLWASTRRSGSFRLLVDCFITVFALEST